MGEPVTVLGAGIVGICCALSLQDRGLTVRLIDRGAPGQETSFGNAGVISPWSIVPMAVPGIWKSIPGMVLDRDAALSVQPSFWPRMIPWGLQFLRASRADRMRATSDAMEVLCGPSIDLFRRHLAGTGHEDLVVDSWYIHAFRDATKASLAGTGYALRLEKGADVARIEGDELRRLEPALSTQFKAAIVIKGQARARSPGRIATVLAEKLVQNGGTFQQADVTGLARGAGGGWTLHTTGADITCDRLVLAAGVWSAGLLKPLGITMPLVAERGYHVAFPTPSVALNNSVMDVDAKVVASSMEDGLRVAGTSEFGATDAPVNPRKADQLARQARAMLPDLDPAEMRTWMGQRPSFPDSLPALGSVAGQPDLFAAFGHAHFGLMMAPKTGELVADIVSGTPPNIDLSPYDPLRF